MNQEPRRPIGVTLLCFFFAFGALASGASAVMLLLPGTSLDVLWRLNPQARHGLMSMGFRAIVLMSVVSVACASAALGLWNCRRWGYWMALCILVVNLVGDTSNAFLLKDWRTLIGLPVVGIMIVYLLRNHAIFSNERRT